MQKYVELEPGWLDRQMIAINAWQRAQKKIMRAYDAARKNGRTEPVSIEFTVLELQELASIARPAL